MGDAAKRAFDVVAGGVALALSAPLLVILAAAVKIDSRGPAMFVQTRVGRDGKPIRIVKLRTMSADAETFGPAITAGGDRRITRVGRVLRKTKLDELPQLWNVVAGHMSIVGPRPEVPSYVSGYRPEWMKLLSVRPGLTDLASLTFRDEEVLLALAADRERAYIEVLMPMKLQLALEGLEKSSLRYDLEILLRTLGAVFMRRSRHAETVTAAARQAIEKLNRTIETT